MTEVGLWIGKRGKGWKIEEYVDVEILSDTPYHLLTSVFSVTCKRDHLSHSVRVLVSRNFRFLCNTYSTLQTSSKWKVIKIFWIASCCALRMQRNWHIPSGCIRQTRTCLWIYDTSWNNNELYYVGDKTIWMDIMSKELFHETCYAWHTLACLLDARTSCL